MDRDIRKPKLESRESPPLPPEADAADLVVVGRRVVLPDRLAPAAVVVAGGRVVRIAPFEEGASAGCPVVDFGDDVVMAGLVDAHVHVNEPGRSEWEGFATATRAAAAGGVTTIIDMPLNSIPATTTVAGFNAKAAALRGKCSVDVGLWGGIVPGNLHELVGLLEAGALGFKCFLVDSGVAEFPAVGEIELLEALSLVSGRGAPVLFHAEAPGPIAARSGWEKATRRAGRSYLAYLESRPKEAEDEAIELVVHLCRRFGTSVHIVHLSSSRSLPLLRQARREGLPVTVETCPHYLFFDAEEIPSGDTRFKCAPPIRDTGNRRLLWDAVTDGTIDMIATDHSPCPPELKCLDDGNFAAAWGGISSLQLGLAAVWTEMRRRGFTVRHLASLMCEAPARLAGLAGCKGVIAPGADADLVVWRPGAAYVVDPLQLHHRHKLTPYEGRELYGQVLSTYVRGVEVFARCDFPCEPAGRLLVRH